jgi:hypothetical protein
MVSVDSSMFVPFSFAKIAHSYNMFPTSSFISTTFIVYHLFFPKALNSSRLVLYLIYCVLDAICVIEKFNDMFATSQLHMVWMFAAFVQYHMRF